MRRRSSSASSRRRPSRSASVTTIAVQVLPGAPGPPSNVVAAAGDGSAAVSWLPPVKDGGAAISGYTVTPHDVTTGSDGQPVGAVGTSASVTGLANGDAYTFTVTASNSAGPGRPSAPSASVTPQGGSAPPVATAGDRAFRRNGDRRRRRLQRDAARSGGDDTDGRHDHDRHGAAERVAAERLRVRGPAGRDLSASGVGGGAAVADVHDRRLGARHGVAVARAGLPRRRARRQTVQTRAARPTPIPASRHGPRLPTAASRSSSSPPMPAAGTSGSRRLRW